MIRASRTAHNPHFDRLLKFGWGKLMVECALTPKERDQNDFTDLNKITT